MFIRKAGFSVLEGYDLTTRQNASEAMNATQDELESLRYQLGKLAETFSHLRFNAERNQSREKTINISQASITDTDVAREATKLAKNLIVKEATNSALIQARISAETVFNLLV